MMTVQTIIKKNTGLTTELELIKDISQELGLIK